MRRFLDCLPAPALAASGSQVRPATQPHLVGRPLPLEPLPCDCLCHNGDLKAPKPRLLLNPTSYRVRRRPLPSLPQPRRSRFSLFSRKRPAAPTSSPTEQTKPLVGKPAAAQAAAVHEVESVAEPPGCAAARTIAGEAFACLRPSECPRTGSERPTEQPPRPSSLPCSQSWPPRWLRPPRTHARTGRRAEPWPTAATTRPPRCGAWVR